MNIFIIFTFVILLTSGVQTFAIEESTALESRTEQRALLKKLQNFQEAKNVTKPLMWNEILADVLVNKVKIFSLKRDNVTTINKDTRHNALTKWFGTVLVFYKNFVYDKLVYTPKDKNLLNIVELSDANYTVDTKTREEPLNHFQDTAVNNILNSTNPKADVEIIEPKYHGRLTNDNDTEKPNRDVTEKPDEEDKAIVCPEGYLKSDRGCLDAKSRLILAVPNQCPRGYRLDRLGYCRIVFTFMN